MAGSSGEVSDTMTESRAGAIAFVLGASLVVLAAAAFAFGTVGFAFGLSIGPWIALPALAAQAAFAFFTWRAEDPARAVTRTVVTVVVGWLLLVAAVLGAGAVADTSVDGRHYQGESVEVIAAGWNPVRDGALRWPPGNPDVWTNSYPKAAWVVEAAILRATDFEAAKALGLLLLAAAALLSFAGLAQLGLGPAAATIGAVALALNPVASAQAATHMVDGILSSLLLSSIMLAVLLYTRRRPLAPLIALGVALGLLVNVKFTGLVLAVLVALLVLVVGVWREGIRPMVRVFVVLGAVLAVSVAAFGFNPYVTNTLRFRNPFHPLVGPNAIDIAEVHTGRGLQDMSSFERLGASIVSRTNASGAKADAKIPFTFTSTEWDAFEFPNVRVGGFGPLFSGVLLFALATAIGLMVLRLRRGRAPTRAGVLLLATAAVLAATVVLFPDAFLARFAPQLWFVPLLVLVVGLQVDVARPVRVLAWCGLMVALVNAVGVASVATNLDVRASRRQESSLEQLRSRPAPLDAEFGRWVRAETRRLREAGIRFRPVARVRCADPLGLTFDGHLVRDAERRSGGRRFRGVLLCPRGASDRAG